MFSSRCFEPVEMMMLRASNSPLSVTSRNVSSPDDAADVGGHVHDVVAAQLLVEALDELDALDGLEARVVLDVPGLGQLASRRCCRKGSSRDWPGRSTAPPSCPPAPRRRWRRHRSCLSFVALLRNKLIIFSSRGLLILGVGKWHRLNSLCQKEQVSQHYLRPDPGSRAANSRFSLLSRCRSSPCRSLCRHVVDQRVIPLDVYPPVAVAFDAGFGPAVFPDVVAGDGAVELLPQPVFEIGRDESLEPVPARDVRRFPCR